MIDTISSAGGLPPDRPRMSGALAEVLNAHGLAVQVIEQICELHVALPDSLAIRDRVGPFLTGASAIEDAVVAELQRLLEADLTEANVALVEAHADEMFDLRPSLGRFVYQLLLGALARRAGLRSAP